MSDDVVASIRGICARRETLLEKKRQMFFVIEQIDGELNELDTAQDLLEKLRETETP